MSLLALTDPAAIAVGRFTRARGLVSWRYLVFLMDIFRNLPSVFSKFHLPVEQMYTIGVTSIPLIVTTSVFTGAVMAWQLAYQFADMIPLTYVGMAVGKSVMVELGPILTAMVLAGRIGAAMCSELGTMAVTEQLDAMKVLGLNPFRFLLAPRVFAAMVMLPVLTVISMAVALMGGWLTAFVYKDVSWHLFFFGVRLFYQDWDLVVGLLKAVMFGLLISSFATFFGYFTTNGAEGVGKSTKATVVASMTSILIGGFVLSKFLLV